MRRKDKTQTKQIANAPAWISEFSENQANEDEVLLSRRMEERRKKVEFNLAHKKLGNIVTRDGRVVCRKSHKKRKVAENPDDSDSDFG